MNDRRRLGDAATQSAITERDHLPPDDPWRRLAAAVLLQAVRDLRALEIGPPGGAYLHGHLLSATSHADRLVKVRRFWRSPWAAQLCSACGLACPDDAALERLLSRVGGLHSTRARGQRWLSG